MTRGITNLPAKSQCAPVRAPMFKRPVNRNASFPNGFLMSAIQRVECDHFRSVGFRTSYGSNICINHA